MTTLFTKDVTIPTLSSGVVACVSLVFYVLLAQTINTELLAAFIATTSLAAMVQILFVPQAWIYVFGSQEQTDSSTRLSSSALVEAGGGLAGLMIVIPLVLVANYGVSLLLAYCALVMAGATSAQGYIRSKGQWKTYSIFVTMPSLLRLVIAVISMLSDTNHTGNLPQIIIVYLLIPEGVRYLFFNIPLIISNWQTVNPTQILQTSRHLFRNWLYDVGSATTEVADKYIISLMVNPNLLITYFFVRKISSAVTMVLEPFYSSLYRKISTYNTDTIVFSMLALPLMRGYLLSALICATLLLAITTLSFVSIGKVVLIPEILFTNMQFAILCLFIDGAIAANRWGRYISILKDSAIFLLLARIICFSVFMLIVYSLSSQSDSMALAIGFLCYAILEFAYVTGSTRGIKSF